MFSKEDRQYLNKQEYSMALEKFFSKELNSSYYLDQNDVNRKEKDVGMNFAIEQVYPFSNEDLGSTFENIDLLNKTIACTGSGGDEILIAIALGADKIIHVDGNLYAEPFIKYKLAAIQVLSHEEFIKYFIENQDYFNLTVFQKVFPLLDKDSQTFWGIIYTENGNPKEIKERMIQPGKKGYEESTALLRHKKYYDFLQESLQKKDFDLRFETAEFNEFPEVINDKCDVIMLSNIQQYVNPQDYINVVNKLYDEKLNEGGKIQLSYTFSRANLSKAAQDLTSTFQKFFQDKQDNITMLELENKDKTFFLEKPKQKEPQLNEEE